MSQSKLMLTTIACSAFALFGGGCGGEEEKESQQIVQQRPKSPPRPASRTVAKLIEALSLDSRIQFDEIEAPKSEAQRIALLTFFDAMLRADADSLKGMLTFKDQLELDAMMNDGFASTMEDVSLVMLKTGESPEGKPCVMAIYELGLNYQIQLWFIENSSQSSTFTAVETPPHLVDKLSGKWIDNYFEWKSKQTEIAQQPDEDTSYALAGEKTSSSGSQGGGSNPGIPGGPGRSGRSSRWSGRYTRSISRHRRTE